MPKTKLSSNKAFAGIILIIAILALVAFYSGKSSSIGKSTDFKVETLGLPGDGGGTPVCVGSDCGSSGSDPRNPTPQCTKDEDCPSGEFCSRGVCSYTQDPNKQCNYNGDCGACQDCISGVCTFRCPSNVCHATSCGTGCSSGKCPGEPGY